MWIIRDQTILINKTCTVPGILVEIFLFFSSSEFAVCPSYSMNSELTESSLLILSIVSANRLATLNW
jgi:hypothetical protein